MKTRWIGSTALRLIAQEKEARLIGRTSRGLFLRITSDWILFLTDEPYRGPLTLNLDSIPRDFREALSDPISIQADGLWFSKSGLRVPVEDAKVWNPYPEIRKALPRVEIMARVEEMSPLSHAPEDLFTSEAFDGIIQAEDDRDAEEIASRLTYLLGRGPGLTPAGDDVVLGLLLTLNRWKSIFSLGFTLEALNAQFIREARERTTTLSTNLIECAAEGQADERLITGLDRLVTGTADTTTCAASFNGWGSTSGGSVFSGIKIAFSLAQPFSG